MTRAFAFLTAPFYPIRRLVISCAAVTWLSLGALTPASAQTTSTAANPPAAAQPAPSPASSLPWQSLSASQKQVLAPLEAEWNQLEPSRRGKWLELAARYPQMPPDEQARVGQRMSDWSKLSPAERQQARLTYQSARQIQADERQAKWEAYQALPEEKRQQLADKAAQKASQQKSGGALGKTASGTAVTPQNSSGTPAKPRPGLVPLPPAQDSQALGPVLLQAHPGATTVLISTGRTQARQPAGPAKLGLDMSRLDANTLLPKPVGGGQRQ